jgi:hypothetical protein
VILSNSHRFIFIHIPKTGGTAIAKALAPFDRSVERKGLRRLLSHLPVPEDADAVAFRIHVSARWVKAKIPAETFAAYAKFAVVRNPFDRAVSYYHYLVQNEAHHRHDKVRGMNFEAFLEYLLRRRSFHNDTQFRMVSDATGKMLVDHILRYESLADDFLRLCETLGLPAQPLERHNASRRDAYETYYKDGRAREMVLELFSEDFAAFGYDRQVTPAS